MCEIVFPTPIKRKAAPNSSHKVSICVQEFLNWIFQFHFQLLITSANLRVASISMRSQSCFNVIVQIPDLQVTLLVQKGARTPFPRISIPLHPWKQAVISQAICIGKTLAHEYKANTQNLLAKVFQCYCFCCLSSRRT